MTSAANGSAANQESHSQSVCMKLASWLPLKRVQLKISTWPTSAKTPLSYSRKLDHSIDHAPWQRVCKQEKPDLRMHLQSFPPALLESY